VVYSAEKFRHKHTTSKTSGKEGCVHIDGCCNKDSFSKLQRNKKQRIF
jgi:hypothetical protein